jgi:hypothetical protein
MIKEPQEGSSDVKLCRHCFKSGTVRVIRTVPSHIRFPSTVWMTRTVFAHGLISPYP